MLLSPHGAIPARAISSVEYIGARYSLSRCAAKERMRCGITSHRRRARLKEQLLRTYLSGGGACVPLWFKCRALQKGLLMQATGKTSGSKGPLVGPAVRSLIPFFARWLAIQVGIPAVYYAGAGPDTSRGPS